MKASDLTLLGFACWLACACAETYDPSPPGTLASAVLTPTGGVGGTEATGGAAADPSMGGVGGVGGIAPPLGEPCTQNDMLSCPCEGSDVQGQRICRFDMASPMDGFFTDCQGCPLPMEPEPTAGAGGMGGAGGMSSAGAGGMAGSSAGTAGDPPDAGPEEEPTEPVDDCEGVPEGTECDRDCILPSNTARCNERGDCSCL